MGELLISLTDLSSTKVKAQPFCKLISLYLHWIKADCRMIEMLVCHRAIQLLKVLAGYLACSSKQMEPVKEYKYPHHSYQGGGGGEVQLSLKFKLFNQHVCGTPRTLQFCPSPLLENLVLCLRALRTNLMKTLVSSAHQSQWVCNRILLSEVLNVALHGSDMLC